MTLDIKEGSDKFIRQIVSIIRQRNSGRENQKKKKKKKLHESKSELTISDSQCQDNGLLCSSYQQS